MTNRERAKAWILDTYPSAWEADHVDSLTALLNTVSQDVRRRALDDAAKLVTETNYYEDSRLTARRIRNYDGDGGPKVGA